VNRIILSLIIVFVSLSSHAGDSVVARVNGVDISSRALEVAVNALIPRSTYHGSISEEKRNEFRKKALEDLIAKELQYQDAVARGMKPAKKQVKARMKEIRKRFKSKKAYTAAMKQAGITQDELRESVAREVLIQQAIEETVTEQAQMTDTALREYYQNNTAKFRQPESVRLRMISTKNQEKAQRILAQVKEGKDFANLAARESEDNYRIKGGDIGYIHKGRVFPELEDAAFVLKPGETSGLVKAQGTWFIIKVEDKRPEHQLSFNEARDKLKKELEDKRAAELMEKWISDLRAKAKIEILMKK